MIKIIVLAAIGCLYYITSLVQLSDKHQDKKENFTINNNATALKPYETAVLNYKNYCAGCHGEKMDAFVDRKWKHGNKKEDLYKAIKVGYADDGMPGFDSAFTDNEINELADYILKGIENVKKYDFANERTPLPDVFKSDELNYKAEKVVDGVDVPWGFTFLPDGDMLVTDRNGKFYRSKNGKLSLISGTPKVMAEGQGGLLDVTLHPDFKKNNFVYLSYSIFKEEGGKKLSSTAVMRAKLTGTTLSNEKVIFEALPYSTTRHHYGSRLIFDKQGFLYISVGERGNQNENPQNLSNFLGKVHRIKDDGSIPADNPFVNKAGAVKSIYSYGHRNPQGMDIDPKTGKIWTNEHGPRGGDEINIVSKAANYGWPVTSYGINYNGTTFTDKSVADGISAPLHYWIPSIGPSGMAFITGNRYKGWEGGLLVGSLRFKYLDLCKMDGEKVVKEQILLKNIGRVRTVKMGPDGYIYVGAEDPGAIYKLVPVI